MWIGHRKEIRQIYSSEQSSKRQLSNLFTVANSHYQPSWYNPIIPLYFPPTQHHSFFGNLPLYFDILKFSLKQ